MPEYSDSTDEGPLDFPFCPHCHELMFGEICSWCEGEPDDAA